jgi:hypothetical protein
MAHNRTLVRLLARLSERETPSASDVVHAELVNGMIWTWLDPFKEKLEWATVYKRTALHGSIRSSLFRLHDQSRHMAGKTASTGPCAQVLRAVDEIVRAALDGMLQLHQGDHTWAVTEKLEHLATLLGIIQMMPAIKGDAFTPVRAYIAFVLSDVGLVVIKQLSRDYSSMPHIGHDVQVDYIYFCLQNEKFMHPAEEAPREEAPREEEPREEAPKAGNWWDDESNWTPMASGQGRRWDATQVMGDFTTNGMRALGAGARRAGVRAGGGAGGCAGGVAGVCVLGLAFSLFSSV